MIMILGFVGFTINDVEYAGGVFSSGKDFIIGTLDWFYVLVVNLILFFVFWLLMSRFGNVKLGKDDDEPDFSTFSWICIVITSYSIHYTKLYEGIDNRFQDILDFHQHSLPT